MQRQQKDGKGVGRRGGWGGTRLTQANLHVYVFIFQPAKGRKTRLANPSIKRKGFMTHTLNTLTYFVSFWELSFWNLKIRNLYKGFLPIYSYLPASLRYYLNMTKSTLLFIWIVLHFSLFFRLCIRICFNVQNKNPSRKYLNFVSVSQASSVSHESEEQRWKSGKGCCAYFMAVDFSWLNSAALGCPGCWFINFSLAFCSLLWLLFLSRLLALTSIAIERTYNQCAHLADTICTYVHMSVSLSPIRLRAAT